MLANFISSYDLTNPSDLYQEFRGVTSPLYWASRYFSYTAVHRESRMVRNAFSQNQIPQTRPVNNHSHANSANERSNARGFMLSIATALGRTPYMLSTSMADQRDGHRGERIYHHLKDVTQSPQLDMLQDDNVVSLVDVDYFLDMPWLLTRTNAPVLAYTATPTAVTGKSGDATFRFVNGLYEERVSGGAQYSHKLWNYSSDALSVLSVEWLKVFYRLSLATAAAIAHNTATVTPNLSRRISIFGKLFGVTRRLVGLLPLRAPLRMKWMFRLSLLGWFAIGAVRHVSYSVHGVERRSVSSHRSVILLTCKSKWRGFSALAARLWFRKVHNPLRRLVVKHGDYNVLRSVDKNGPRISVGRDGTYLSASIPEATLDALKVIQERTSKLTRGDVRSYLPNDDYADENSRKVAAVAIYDYVVGTSNSEIDTAYIVKYKATPYSVAPRDSAEDRDSMMPIMNPLIPGAVFPVLNKQAEINAINKRVKQVATPVKPPTRFVLKCVNEFATFLVPPHLKHTLAPVDDQVVWERQARPTQRAILERVDRQGGHLGHQPTQTFLKREGYGDIKPARIISVIPGQTKREYSAYTYALSDYAKNWSWYAFGQTPKAIAAKVASVCDGARDVNTGDLSRMDGRVGNIGRLLTSSVALRAFHPMYQEELDALMQTQYHTTAITTENVKYETLWSRLSGSPETSIFNTIEVAFTAYLAARYMKQSPSKAYETVCSSIFGGDDSLMREVASQQYVQACKALGHKAESRVYKNGETGVNFLARIYSPEVWSGNTESMSDTKRQLAKLHLTVTLNGASKKQKLIEKARSFMLTDALTPILGDFCKRALELGVKEGLTPSEQFGERWWDRYQETDQFPQDREEWMINELRNQLPTLEEKSMLMWIDSCATLDELMDCPGFMPEEKLKVEEGNVDRDDHDDLAPINPTLDPSPKAKPTCIGGVWYKDNKPMELKSWGGKQLPRKGTLVSRIGTLHFTRHGIRLCRNGPICYLHADPESKTYSISSLKKLPKVKYAEVQKLRRHGKGGGTRRRSPRPGRD